METAEIGDHFVFGAFVVVAEVGVLAVGEEDAFVEVGDDETCEHGLHFTEDGHLILSGIKIQWIETFDAQGHGELHPWPFGEEPLARTWKPKK